MTWQDKKLFPVEKLKKPLWAVPKIEMPEVTEDDRCPIRCSCNREQNNKTCQTFGGQTCGNVQEYWRQKIYQRERIEKSKQHQI